MKYEIRLEKSFIKRMDNLSSLFKLSRTETNEVRNTIIDMIEILENGKTLLEDFSDHVLQKEPWRGFHEFHVMSDLLVVYYKVDKKKRIRMITITSHQELSTGKLSQ